MYLTDEDLIEMLQRCAKNLKKDGIIMIKENVFDEDEIGQFFFDTEDNSVIRKVDHFKSIIKKSGLEIVDEQ